MRFRNSRMLMRTPHSRLAALALTAMLIAGVAAQDLTLPNKPKDTLKFAVIGDSGTGDSNQYRLAKVFTDMHQRFPYEFVLMLATTCTGGKVRATSSASSRFPTSRYSTGA